MRLLAGPTADLDYFIDWSQWLASGETVTTSTWTIPSGLTRGDETSEASGKQIVWLTGGEAGTTYTITNTIITSANRRDRRSLEIRVEAR